jgi:hypothetical protein
MTSRPAIAPPRSAAASRTGRLPGRYYLRLSAKLFQAPAVNVGIPLSRSYAALEVGSIRGLE